MKVEAKVSGIWINLPNAAEGTTLTRPINGIAIFRIILDKPTMEQINNIKTGTEIKFYDDDFTFLGVVKKTRVSTSRIEIEGTGYEMTLNNIMINASNTSHEDTSLSSGYTVVYNNTNFRTVVIDILNGTGISASSSTVDTIGNINIKFKNTYVLEGIKKLAELSGYYWWIDSSKTLHMKSSRGSSTSVLKINLYGEAVLVEEYIDRNRMCNKAIVFGAGNTSGTAQDSTSISTYGLKEGRFKFSELQTNSECSQRAQKIVNEFKDPIHIIKITTMKKGYDLGDTISLFGREVDGDYRITKIVYSITGRRALELTSAGLKHRTDEFYEEIERLIRQGSSNIAEITTGDKIEEMIFSHVQDASTSNHFRFRFYIDPEKVSDILQAKLYVVRDYVNMPYGDETDNSYAYFSQTDHDHSQNAPSQNDHDHYVSGTTTLYADGSLYTTGDSEFHYVSYTSFSSSGWNTLLSNSHGLDALYYGSIQAWVNIQNFTGNDQYYDVDLAVSGLTGWPNGTPKIYIPKDRSGSIYLEWPAYMFGWSSMNNIELRVNDPVGLNLTRYSAYLIGTKPHNHGISGRTSEGNQADIQSGTPTQGGQADLTDNTHKNPLKIDIDKYDDGNDHKHRIYIDGDYWGYKYLERGDTFEIDISSDITSTGWHVIEIYPTSGNVFLSAQVKLKIFKIE